jgi:hypothetical protein
MNTEATDSISGWSPAATRALDTTHECVGRRQVLRGREEQGHVDRYTGEDRLLDGRKPILGAGDLDEEVRRPARA